MLNIFQPFKFNDSNDDHKAMTIYNNHSIKAIQKETFVYINVYRKSLKL